MSVRRLVTYGNRLYSQTTYATNIDREHFYINLSESVTLSDLSFNEVIIAINDAISLSDTLSITFRQVTLSDFIILNEWLTVTLIKANIWGTAIPAGTTWTNPPTSSSSNWTNQDGTEPVN